MHAADLDQIFTDWGVSITWRQIAAIYDPATLTTVETPTNTTLTALINSAPTEPLPATAGRTLARQLSLFFRTADLPAGSPALTDRIVYDNIVHQVAAFTISPDGGTTHVIAVRP